MRRASQSNPLDTALDRFFREHKIRVTRLRAGHYVFPLATGAATLHLDVVIAGRDDRAAGSLQQTAALPVTVPPEHFAAVLCCLNRLNSRLGDGAWFVDGESGHICLRLVAHAVRPDRAEIAMATLVTRTVGLIEPAAGPLLALAFAGGDPGATAAAIIHATDHPGGAASPGPLLMPPANVRPELN